MNKKLSRLPLFIVAAFFVVVFLFTAARPVAAVASPWVRWKVNLSFPNDTLHSQLVIEKGHTTLAGTQVIDDEKKFVLPCQEVGAPVISGGLATFDGSSYVRCAVPSIKEQVWKEWQMAIPNSCSGKRPYIVGDVAVAGNPIDADPENPIFYRHDIQLHAPFDASTQEASLDMAFGPAAAESGTFAVNSAGHSFAAFIDRSGPSTFTPSFIVDGNSLSAAPVVITQAPVLSNLESIIYFGYSPLSGEYFEGSLGPLEVDPVCPTTG